jgi:hypothetical protein
LIERLRLVRQFEREVLVVIPTPADDRTAHVLRKTGNVCGGGYAAYRIPLAVERDDAIAVAAFLIICKLARYADKFGRIVESHSGDFFQHALGVDFGFLGAPGFGGINRGLDAGMTE